MLSLHDILVISVRKNFWAAPECEVFPNRIYTLRLLKIPGRLGSSRNPLNNLTAALQGYLYFLRKRPRLILIGSANRVAPWFAWLKAHKLLPGTKLVVITQSYLRDTQVKVVDRLVVFCRSEIKLHDPALREKYTFLPIPADGQFDHLNISSLDYIFAGGGAGRDFSSLIEAVRGLDVKLKIVTFNPATLGYSGKLPENVEVHWKMPINNFIEIMYGARFVVAPLQEGSHPHGHTTVVQALRTGKAVISTRNASIDDYITNGKEGLLVQAGNISEYRAAILKFLQDEKLLAQCASFARLKAGELTYKVFAENLAELCQKILST